MRITAGTLRGRLLSTPRGRHTRPTSSKVREAIFNILGGRVPGARVLDLYAGSGAMGVEALSRGAASCVFVDASRVAAGAISRNLRDLGLEDRGRVLCQAVVPALRVLSRAGEEFELVFMDAPYSKAVSRTTLAEAAESGVLTEKGLVVVEHTKREALAEKCGSLELHVSRRYGDTQVSVFVNSTGQAGSAKNSKGGTG